jgi:Tol biopolymer transport system component
MRTITSGVAGVGVVIAVAVAPGLDAQRSAGDAETVVYSSLAPGNWDLYRFDRPGEPPRRLTTDPGLDYNPVVSPDGRWVVFTSERAGSPDLYALDLERGGEPVRLTASDAMEDAADFSPDGRTLVFVGSQSGNADVYSMRFDPGNPDAEGAAVNLTRHAAGDYNPAMSPDGTQILFSSGRAPNDAAGPLPAAGDEASELYLMRADGTNVRRLTRHDGWDGSPAWSKDGQAVLFYSERDGEPRIFEMPLDGTVPRALSQADRGALSPVAGPDGRVAFTSRHGDRWNVVSVEADGGGLRVESDETRDYWGPTFDASGRVVAFGPGPTGSAPLIASDVPGPFLVHPTRSMDLPDRTLALTGVRGYLPTLHPSGEEVATSEAFVRLVVSRLDGSGKRVVFDPGHGDGYRGAESPWWPAWSRDGNWLVFGVGAPFGGPSDDVNIWKSRPDGTDAENLTPDSGANDALPQLSPDGGQIVFRTMRDGNAEIYVMNVDGGQPRRLTHHPATDTMPSFSSKGDRVAFTSLRDDDYEVYLLELNAEGGAGRLERLTHSPGRDMHPRFSPDDQWVIFTSERGGLNDELPLTQVVFQPQPYGEIHAIRLSDRHVVRLTHNKWEDGPADWVK